VLTLVGGVAAGLQLDDDHEQQVAAASVDSYTESEAADLKTLKAHAGVRAQEIAAAQRLQAEVQARADAEAKAAADRARAAEKEASRRGADRPVNYGPIPPSCSAFSGNRAIGCAELLIAGYGLEQMPCLDKLWTKESGWNHQALNKSSGAYGIPQSLPGSKMATIADDWQTNPATQIKWGLSYIKKRYGAPCVAWQHSIDNGWY
jgi:soluble lytic murein transglycosylase-like protein